MTTKVVKGSMWTLAGQAAPLAVSFVTTPFVIRMLGSEGYGVLVLIGLIPTYLGFADLGMSMASTKFGSEAYAEGDEEKEARIVRTAALIALMTSVPISAALMIFASPLISLFNVPEALQGEAVLALRIAAVTFVINFLCTVFNTPQLARLRMDLNTFINAGARILGLVAIPIVLLLGLGIIGAVTALLFAGTIGLIGHLLVSRSLLRTLFGTSLDSGLALNLLRFGVPLAISSIAAVLLANVEKLILPGVSSVQVLAYYSVAFTFANMATMFSGAMSQSLVPAFSQLFVPGNRGHLNSLYSRSIRLNIVCLLPALIFLAVIGKPFFTIWAGEEFGQESTLPFYVLLVGLFFHLSSYVSGGLVIASGRTDIIAKLYWVQLLPYLAVVALLTMRFGAVGAAAAWSLRVFFEFFVLVFIAKRIASVQTGLVNKIAGLLTGSLILSPVVFLLWFFENDLWLISVAASVSFATYAVWVWRSLLDSSERQWVIAKLRLVY